jgi:chloramphenicol 3-O phosphotransferase
MELFAGLDVIFIGVHCPLEELERREKERKDRRKGEARLTVAIGRGKSR